MRSKWEQALTINGNGNQQNNRERLDAAKSQVLSPSILFARQATPLPFTTRHTNCLVLDVHGDGHLMAMDAKVPSSASPLVQLRVPPACLVRIHTSHIHSLAVRVGSTAVISSLCVLACSADARFRLT